ncbi:glycosyltransferase family 2 protein [Flavobacterium facile]|uniref:glycosyltransferase family 2 protein n=1 Tax=Flavobacterium facile TaxID=2893174 RepID=UPI002E79F2D5|nr:glycosyltransferase family 2 protein [Flavobacterium sp. T-12]
MIKTVTVVMPCLNEAQTLETCIKKAQFYFTNNNIDGEIIIADNGSTDGSQDIAQKLGAKVVSIPQKGYGNALKGGINQAKGDFIIMGDADDSYDFSKLELFINKLNEGADFVIGNRFKGGIEKNAMPFLHKYLGNPVLSFLGRLFFNSKIGDFHCGLRGFTKEAYQKLELTTSGMEFASELIVKAHLNNLTIAEVPTILHKDGRNRKPHLNTWQDGWRHLRFLLLYSPKWLFFYPSVLMMLTGFILSLFLIIAPIKIGNIVFDVHTLLYSTALFIIGFQFFVFYGLTKVFAVTHKLLPKSDRYDAIFKFISLEKGIVIGFLFTIIGIILSIFGFSIWSKENFGPLNVTETLRIIIPAVSIIVIGIEIILFSFFFSILGLRNEKN